MCSCAPCARVLLNIGPWIALELPQTSYHRIFDVLIKHDYMHLKYLKYGSLYAR